MEAEPVPTRNMAQQRQTITPEDPSSYLNSDLSSSGGESDSEDEDLKSDKEPEKDNQLKKGQPKLQENVLEGSLLIKEEESQPQPPKLNPKKREAQQQFKPYPHKLEMKFKILLKIMVAARKVDLRQITGLTQEQGNVEFAFKGTTVIVWAASKQLGVSAIDKLADFVDELNILKLDIRPQFAHKLSSFKGMKRDFFKRLGIFMFGTDNEKGIREAYIGGLVKPSELRKIQQEIKNYKILNFGLKRFQNKRSYQHIINKILNSELAMEELQKFNKITLIEIDKHSKQPSLRYFMNTISKLEISAVEYEVKIYQIIKRFFSVTFTLRKQKFYPKPDIKDRSDIMFSIVKDHNVPLAYLYLICPIETFFSCSEAIEKEIEKLGELIIGIRFFNHLEPNFRLFQFDNDFYLVKKFPYNNTYSMCVSAKTKQNKQFSWKQVYNEILQKKDQFTEQGGVENSIDLNDQ